MTKLIPLGNGIIIINTDKKPSREEIKKQLVDNALNCEPFDDELVFEKHLIRKYSKGGIE